MLETRIATYLDIPRLEFLMSLHWEEAMRHSSPLQYDSNTCIKNLYRFLIDDGHLFIVVEQDGVIVGYFWLYVAAPHFTDEVYANEQYIFVHPAYRKSGRCFVALLRRAAEAARSIGCKFLQVGTLGGVERQERAYSKRFKKMGSIYHIPLTEESEWLQESQQ